MTDTQLLTPPDTELYPHLMAAFTQLTEKIQLQLDDDHSALAEWMLNLLSPHVFLNIPSMTIAQLQVDQHNLTNAIILNKEDKIFTTHPEKFTFTPTQKTTIWPIELVHGAFTSTLCDSQLTIQLQCSQNFHELSAQEFNEILFYIDAPAAVTEALQILLYSRLNTIELWDKEHKFEITADNLLPGGFTEHEQLFPYNPNTERGISLLTDYFAFNKKFNFFILQNLKKIFTEFSTHQITCQFNFTEPNLSLANHFTLQHLKLNCLPLINLFKQFAEPFKLDQYEFEYPLFLGQVHTHAATEIEKLSSVHLKFADRSVKAIPYYGQVENESNSPYLYFPRKALYLEPDDPSWRLSFANFSSESQPIVITEVYCANSDTSVLCQDRFSLQLEDKKTNYLKNISTLDPCTPQRKWLQQSQDYWHYISFLTINFNFVTQDTAELTDNFKKILMQFASITPSIHEMLLPSIQVLHCKSSYKKAQHYPSLVRCLDFTLELDIEYFHNHNLFLFGLVLVSFLQSYAPINFAISLDITHLQKTVHNYTYPQSLGTTLG